MTRSDRKRVRRIFGCSFRGSRTGDLGYRPELGALEDRTLLSLPPTSVTAASSDSLTVVQRSIAAVEDVGFSGVVATVEDTNHAAQPGDFQATIDWGDETSSEQATVAADDSGGFTVSGSHTYTAPGQYPLHVTVIGPDGQGVQVTETAGIGQSSAARPTFIGGLPGIPAGADLDGNGTEDLVVPDSTPGSTTISVLLGQGDGTFAPPVRYTVGSQPVDAVIGDFNGDGKPDIATADAGSSDISILLGKGDGTFGAAITTTLTVAPGFLAVGDFNGDGKLDLAVNHSNSPFAVDFATILLGQGDGTFGAPTDVGKGTGSGPISVGDLNADGKADLVVANDVSKTTSILLGNGDGTFDAAGDVSGVVTIGGYLNDDCFPDLIGDTIDGVGVMLGQGDGTFAAETDYPVTAQFAQLAAGDFNGDGVPDILVDDRGDPYSDPTTPGGFSILLGRGDGTFQPAGPVAVADYPGPVVLADFNGDGVLDVAAVDSTEVGTVTVTTGLGDGELDSPVVSASSDDPVIVRTADLNGDGKLDLVTTNSGNPVSLSVQLGNGDGTFGSPTDYLADRSLNRITALAIGDVNGDGKPDLIIGDETEALVNPEYFVTILPGNGDGTFGAPTDVEIPSNPAVFTLAAPQATDIGLGDLNGDGKLDIVVLAGVDSGVLLSNGDGTFLPWQFITPTFETSQAPAEGSLALGDFNGDGKLDVATAEFGLITVFQGLGTGAFLPATSYDDGSGQAYGTSYLLATDLNGDGVLDLVLDKMDSSTSSVNLLMGNGDGTFRAAEDLPFPAPTNSYNPIGPIVAVDLNGDNRPELVMAGGLPTSAAPGDAGMGSIGVLYNRGDGSFDPLQVYANGGAYSTGIAAGDFNGDGLPDIITANSKDRTVSVILNETAGHGALVTAAPLSATGTSIDTGVGESFTSVLTRLNAPDPTSTSDDFTATIDWGDGTTSPGIVVLDPDGSGRFDVEGTHSYAQAGHFCAEVNIADRRGGNAAEMSSIEVSDSDSGGGTSTGGGGTTTGGGGGTTTGGGTTGSGGGTTTGGGTSGSGGGTTTGGGTETGGGTGTGGDGGITTGAGTSTGGGISTGGSGTPNGGGTSTSGNPDLSGSVTMQAPAGSPTPASGVGPALVRIERLGVHDQPTRLVLTFSGPLDPAHAVDPANYEVVAAGRDGILGDRDDVVVPVIGFVYRPASRTVALKMGRRINIHHPYRLTVRGTGPNGVTDPAGRPLDGPGNGRAGGDATAIVTWKDIVLPKHGGGGIVGPGELRHLVWPRWHRSEVALGKGHLPVRQGTRT